MSTEYDTALEARLRAWLSSMLPEREQLINSDQPFQAILKDGVILCELINKIVPGSVKRISTLNTAYKQMENITNYLNACRGIGLQKTQLFDTIDLFEGKGMQQVLNNINALVPLGERMQKRLAEKSTSSSNVSVTESSPSVPRQIPTSSAPASSSTVTKSRSSSILSTSPRLTSSASLSSLSSSSELKRSDSSSSITKPDVPLPEAPPINLKEMLIAQRWIERSLDIQCPPDTSFANWLKNGVILCRLINKARSGLIPKIYEGPVAYQQIENIQRYLRACKIIGLKELNLFDTNDLFHEKDLNLVVNHLHVFARKVCTLAGWNGPSIDDFYNGKLPLDIDSTSAEPQKSDVAQESPPLADQRSAAVAPQQITPSQDSVEHGVRVAKEEQGASQNSLQDEVKASEDNMPEKEVKQHEPQKQVINEVQKDVDYAPNVPKVEIAGQIPPCEATDSTELARRAKQEEHHIRAAAAILEASNAETHEGTLEARQEAQRSASDKLTSALQENRRLQEEISQSMRQQTGASAELAEQLRKLEEEKQKLEMQWKRLEEAKAELERQRREEIEHKEKLAEMARKLEAEAAKRLEEMAAALREEAERKLQEERKLREEALKRLEEERKLREEAFKRLEEEKKLKEEATKHLEQKATAQLESMAKKLEEEAAKRLADVAVLLQQETAKKLDQERRARRELEEEAAKLREQALQWKKANDEVLMAELAKLAAEKEELKKHYDERLRMLEKQLREKEASSSDSTKTSVDAEVQQELTNWRKSWRQVTRRMTNMKRELTRRRTQQSELSESSKGEDESKLSSDHIRSSPSKQLPKLKKQPLSKLSSLESDSEDEETENKPQPSPTITTKRPRNLSTANRDISFASSYSSSSSDDEGAIDFSDDDGWSPEGGFQNDEEWSTEEEYTDEDEEPNGVITVSPLLDKPTTEVPAVKAVSPAKASTANDDDEWAAFADIKFK